MSRHVSTPAVAEYHLNRLQRVVQNLFIDNKNLKVREGATIFDSDSEPYYFRTYPNTRTFVREVLTEQAEYLRDEIGSVRNLVVDLMKSYEEEIAELKQQIETLTKEKQNV